MRPLKRGDADVAGTLARLAEIAVVHPTPARTCSCRAACSMARWRRMRTALASVRHESVPVAAMAKLESRSYASHRRAVEAMPVTERAVPSSFRRSDAARVRALRDVAAAPMPSSPSRAYPASTT